MSVDCIVADDNPLLDFISIKNLFIYLFIYLITFSAQSYQQIQLYEDNFNVEILYIIHLQPKSRFVIINEYPTYSLTKHYHVDARIASLIVA